MKTLIALIVLSFSLVCHAAEGDQFFPGAWHITKAPVPRLRQAGGLQIIFNQNNTLDFDIFIGGYYLETATASFTDTGKYYVFTVVDSDGWTWKGKFNGYAGLVTGSFTDSTGMLRGKFQCTREISQALAATESKKAKRLPTP